MKILWLASWYPGRTHATDGDFIERQARAVAQRVAVTVLFVAKDARLPSGAEEVEKATEGNLTIYRVYYAPQRVGGGALEKLLSLRRYVALQKKYYRRIVAEQGVPQLVHVQVAMKAGLLALWLRRRGIPYIVTEHWTGYYPDSSPSIYEQNALYRWLNKRVLQKAQRLLPVSEHLGQTVNQYFVPTSYTAVPNVVDTELFFYRPVELPVFRFIHASYLNHQKNPEGMLRACSLAVAAGAVFELWLVGNEDARLMAMAAELGLLGKTVFFQQAVPHGQVAALMQQSSALLLFSRFENQPCVILEALCCGLPVVSSRVGGIAEVVNESNGRLVPSEDETALADAMVQLIKEYSNYDRPAMAAAAAQRFGCGAVAQQLVALYQTVSGA
jgi:glycosyltransferase involved in cell wall biosynthesis